MTPLAHQLARQLTLPIKARNPYWAANLKSLTDVLDDTHFFEITDVLPLIPQTRDAFMKMSEAESDDVIGSLTFLPAPKTWVEWIDPGCGERQAIFLQENKAETLATAEWFTADAANNAGFMSLTSGDIEWPGGNVAVSDKFKAVMLETGTTRFMMGLLALVQLALVLINSPRIIGRRQHMPHAGLERRLTKSLGVGMFPLHGWTEIKLEVSKPPEIDDGEPHEAHLTGRRALHFCRKHIRIKNGKLEYVRAHWRGDPALGIKRSRYTVAA